MYLFIVSAVLGDAALDVFVDSSLRICLCAFGGALLPMRFWWCAFGDAM